MKMTARPTPSIREALPVVGRSTWIGFGQPPVEFTGALVLRPMPGPVDHHALALRMAGRELRHQRARIGGDVVLAHALNAGFSEDKIDALREVKVPTALMSRVTARHDPKTVVELVATVAAYNRVSRFLVALNISH